MRSRPRNPAWPSLVWNTCAVDAERLERPDAADAQQDLLAQPVLDVAAVEAVGHESQVVAGSPAMSASSRYSGVRPTVACQTCATSGLAGQVDGHPHAVAQLQGHGVRVQVREPLLLPAVDGERLAEVAVAVEQPDGRQRHPQVGRRLQVVAGQDAETARVLRDRLGDAELGGEVGDDAPVERRLAVGRRGDVARRRLLLEPAGSVS